MKKQPILYKNPTEIFLPLLGKRIIILPDVIRRECLRAKKRPPFDIQNGDPFVIDIIRDKAS